MRTAGTWAGPAGIAVWTFVDFFGTPGLVTRMTAKTVTVRYRPTASHGGYVPASKLRTLRREIFYEDGGRWHAARHCAYPRLGGTK